MPHGPAHGFSAILKYAAFLAASLGFGTAAEPQPEKINSEMAKATGIVEIATDPAKPVAPPIIRNQTIKPKLAPAIKNAAGVRTPPLRFTGTGKPLTGAAMATVAVRTPALAFRGTGAPLVVRVDVGENAVLTPPLRFTGTGSLEP